VTWKKQMFSRHNGKTLMHELLMNTGTATKPYGKRPEAKTIKSIHWNISSLEMTKLYLLLAVNRNLKQPYLEAITRCITLCFWNEHCSTRSRV